MPRYQFHDYAGERARPEVTTLDRKSDSSARSHAGALAKKGGGPVDLARDYTPGRDEADEPWETRYMTTASPSEHHTSGYKFERIEN